MPTPPPRRPAGAPGTPPSARCKAPALADAFAAALAHWPAHGVPQSPETWLMTAAKRRLLELARHRRVARDPLVTALFDGDAGVPDNPGGATLPDARLKLMSVCAQPAVPPAMRAPLMLQTVLGLQAQTIATAFLVSPGRWDARLWQRDMLQQAEQHLWQAARLRQPGPWQLEAAIQSAHCQRAHTGRTPYGRAGQAALAAPALARANRPDRRPARAGVSDGTARATAAVAQQRDV